jgi:hypothetical protein
MATAIPLMAIMIFAGDGAFGEGEGAG